MHFLGSGFSGMYTLCTANSKARVRHKRINRLIGYMAILTDAWLYVNSFEALFVFVVKVHRSQGYFFLDVISLAGDLRKSYVVRHFDFSMSRAGGNWKIVGRIRKTTAEEWGIGMSQFIELIIDSKSLLMNCKFTFSKESVHLLSLMLAQYPIISRISPINHNFFKLMQKRAYYNIGWDWIDANKELIHWIKILLWDGQMNYGVAIRR